MIVIESDHDVDLDLDFDLVSIASPFEGCTDRLGRAMTWAM